jgi:DtxR family transcriptional regulator, Mn-dependent transcriptional regulator
MLSLTVENYLKAILQIELQTGELCVPPGQLATRLGVAPGTVTSMLKTLADSSLASYKPYGGVTLTESGRLLALRMLRRHRLIELFLVKTLDLTWDQVHEEAENMEHAVSDFLVDRIDESLGHPAYDPHGDPIPSVDGELRGAMDDSILLVACTPDTNIELTRVINQNPDFLRFLSESGLSVGSIATVAANNSKAGIVELQLDGLRTSFGYQAAEQLLVRPLLTEVST